MLTDWIKCAVHRSATFFAIGWQVQQSEGEGQRAMVSAVHNFAWRKRLENWDVMSAWNRAVKRTIARFVRGNIAAQNFRVKLPEEQRQQHERAREITNKWRKRR